MRILHFYRTYLPDTMGGIEQRYEFLDALAVLAEKIKERGICIRLAA